MRKEKKNSSQDKKFAFHEEALKTWDWLRKLPAYIQDYAEHSSEEFDEEITQERVKLKVKWGFWPLENPRKQFPRNEFHTQIADKFGLHTYDPGADLEDLDFYLSLSYRYHPPAKNAFKAQEHYPLPALPQKIHISINPKKPRSAVLEEVESLLKMVQEVYKIKLTKPRAHNAIRFQYKAFILKQLGRSNSEIDKELFPDIKGSKHERKSSLRKRSRRVIRKL